MLQVRPKVHTRKGEASGNRGSNSTCKEEKKRKVNFRTKNKPQREYPIIPDKKFGILWEKNEKIFPLRENAITQKGQSRAEGDRDKPMTESSTIKFNGKFPLKGNLNRNIQ